MEHLKIICLKHLENKHSLLCEYNELNEFISKKTTRKEIFFFLNNKIIFFEKILNDFLLFSSSEEKEMDEDVYVNVSEKGKFYLLNLKKENTKIERTIEDDIEDMIYEIRAILNFLEMERTNYSTIPMKNGYYLITKKEDLVLLKDTQITPFNTVCCCFQDLSSDLSGLVPERNYKNLNRKRYIAYNNLKKEDGSLDYRIVSGSSKGEALKRLNHYALLTNNVSWSISKMTLSGKIIEE